MKRFHTASEYFLATGPMVFHSFCNLVSASAVAFQSVLSFRASAFFAKCFLLFQIFVHSFFERFEEFSFLLKKSSQAWRKRSNIFTFIF